MIQYPIAMGFDKEPHSRFFTVTRRLARVYEKAHPVVPIVGFLGGVALSVVKDALQNPLAAERTLEWTIVASTFNAVLRRTHLVTTLVDRLEQQSKRNRPNSV